MLEKTCTHTHTHTHTPFPHTCTHNLPTADLQLYKLVNPKSTVTKSTLTMHIFFVDSEMQCSDVLCKFVQITKVQPASPHASVVHAVLQACVADQWGRRYRKISKMTAAQGTPNRGKGGKSINLIKFDEFLHFSPKWSWGPLDRLKILS